MFAPTKPAIEVAPHWDLLSIEFNALEG